MTDLIYISHYPEQIQQQVRQLISQRQLGNWLAKRYPEKHVVQSDSALFDYVTELKTGICGMSPPLIKCNMTANYLSYTMRWG